MRGAVVSGAVAGLVVLAGLAATQVDWSAAGSVATSVTLSDLGSLWRLVLYLAALVIFLVGSFLALDGAALAFIWEDGWRDRLLEAAKAFGGGAAVCAAAMLMVLLLRVSA